MANIKQQKKRILVTRRQRLENLHYRSTVKTLFKRLIVAVNEGDAEKVAAEHRGFVSFVDKSAARKVLHVNTAARKKARAERIVAAGPQLVETKKKRRVAKK